MKKKISKILGIGLSLALATMLIISALPVLANITQPTVDLDDDIINIVTDYTFQFRVNEPLVATDTITVEFPDDTDVGGVTGASATFTSGIGYDAGTATATVADDDQEVIITLTGFSNTPAGIGDMAYVELSVNGIMNPTEPGTYSARIKTSEEDTYVATETYTIDAPTVGGFIYVYNKSNILLATYGGKWALSDAEDDGYLDGDDYTFKVGAGTYELNEYLTIYGEGLTLESTSGADDTIVDLAGYGIEVYADDVTIDGFTLDDGYDGVYVDDAEGVLVTNCIITDTDYGVYVYDEAVATISDTVFEDCGNGIWVEYAACTVTGVEITGADDYGAIVFDEAGYYDEGTEISGNTITDNDVPGILVYDGTVYDVEISGNTIADNAHDGIHIDYYVEDFVIVENDITGNEGYGIYLPYWDDIEYGNYIMFNNIVDNDDGAMDNESGYDVEAQFNWWGSATKSDIDDEIDGDDVNFEPWLKAEYSGVITDFAVESYSDSLSGKSTAGVAITGMDDDEDPANKAELMVAFGYQANPEDDLDDTIAFYDVYVVLHDDIVMGDVNARIKLYNDDITEASVAHYWSGDFWARCSDQEARDGVIWITVSEDTIPALEDLEATPFAVVAGVAALPAPELFTPTMGDDEVSLTPTFAWEMIDDADGYYLEVADNSAFAIPMVKMEGDLGRLTSTVYGYIGDLDYATAYYWRVKAVSGKVADGDLKQSAWSTGVFVTMAEPEEPTPPVVIEESEPPIITIEQPDIVVPLPAETQITPAWIYVIIGVGAVLVIAVVVLIVRTRRVA